jgi:hypothetical protein
MTISAIGFVPSAPLLVPQVAAGSAGQDADLRLSCLDVVSRALEADPDAVVAVASTRSTGAWTESATASFAGFGVGAAAADPDAALPWPLGVAAWLLDESGWSGRRHYLGLGDGDDRSPDLPTIERAVVIAVGDGSAARTERAPGHLDLRAEGFDDGIADALARGDAAALAGVDAELARELLCGGLPTWRWVAAAVDQVPVAHAELVTHVAPYGVGYFVALWAL